MFVASSAKEELEASVMGPETSGVKIQPWNGLEAPLPSPQVQTCARRPGKGGAGRRAAVKVKEEEEATAKKRAERTAMVGVRRAAGGRRQAWGMQQRCGLTPATRAPRVNEKNAAREREGGLREGDESFEREKD